MKLRTGRGQSCAEAALTTTIETEKTTPATVMVEPAIVPRTERAPAVVDTSSQVNRPREAASSSSRAHAMAAATPVPRAASDRPSHWCGSTVRICHCGSTRCAYALSTKVIVAVASARASPFAASAGAAATPCGRADGRSAARSPSPAFPRIAARRGIRGPAASALHALTACPPTTPLPELGSASARMAHRGLDRRNRDARRVQDRGAAFGGTAGRDDRRESAEVRRPAGHGVGRDRRAAGPRAFDLERQSDLRQGDPRRDSVPHPARRRAPAGGPGRGRQRHRPADGRRRCRT